MVVLKGNRIGAYARFSSDKQSNASIDDQLRRVRGFLAPYGRELSDDLVLVDYATSGTSTNRPGFDALMTKVRRREIDVLLVEDVSRLARDLGDADRLRKELAFYGVQLVSISDGLDSTAKGSTLSFGVKALFAEVYVDDLRDKTLRGMEGRAHAGFSTGGLPYGFRSVPLNSDPRQHAGFRVEIDQEQATRVLWIFDEYAKGSSPKAIALALNKQGVPSPRAGSRHKRQGGWVSSSIRAMLYNERYAGVWTFNERRWVNVPGTKKRRPQKKDASEIIRHERPELRIVPEELWETVRARLARVKALYTANSDGSKKGRAQAGQATPYPLSGILVCDVCGAPMVIHGGDGRRRYYRCSDAANRGTCSNRVSVREDLARAGVLDALRERVASSDALDYLRRKWVAWIAEQERSRGGEEAELRGRLGRTEARLRNVSLELADGNRTDAMRALQRDLEAEAKNLKRQIAERDEVARKPVELPSLAQVRERCLQLEARLREDPVKARESLRRLFDGGAIRMKPLPGGAYEGRAELYPLALVLDSPPAQLPGPAVNHFGSGGRI